MFPLSCAHARARSVREASAQKKSGARSKYNFEKVHKTVYFLTVN
jgi:hypothetical protein